MNRKILLFILSISFFVFMPKVYAYAHCVEIQSRSLCDGVTVNGYECKWNGYACIDKDIKCPALDEKKCNYYAICKWDSTSNACTEQAFIDKPCSENRVKLSLRFFGYILVILKILIPLIIIFFGIFDLLKSVISKDEMSLWKQLKILLIRIALGVFVFFIPSIIHAVFNLSSKTKLGNDYASCETCLLKPSDCQVEELELTK